MFPTTPQNHSYDFCYVAYHNPFLPADINYPALTEPRQNGFDGNCFTEHFPAFLQCTPAVLTCSETCPIAVDASIPQISLGDQLMFVIILICLQHPDPEERRGFNQNSISYELNIPLLSPYSCILHYKNNSPLGLMVFALVHFKRCWWCLTFSRKTHR